MVARLVVALSVLLVITSVVNQSEAQSKKVRVAIPGYTIAVLSFLAAQTNGYYAAEGLDVELVAMRAPTANVAVLSGSVEFSAVPLAGVTTALRGAPLKVLFCQNETAARPLGKVGPAKYQDAAREKDRRRRPRCH